MSQTMSTKLQYSPHHRDRHVINGGEFTAAGAPNDPQQKRNAHHHVQPMQRRADEIKNKKQSCAALLRSCDLEARGGGKQMMGKIVGPFEPKLEDEEQHAQAQGDRAALNQPTGIARAHESHADGVDETAGDENESIEGAYLKIGFAHPRIETCRIGMARIDPGQ